MIHKIKALYDNGEGLKIRAIARQLGLSRTTVKKYLKQEETVTEQQQTVRRRRQRLDGQRDYLIHLLKTFPGLSAAKIMIKLRAKEPQLGVSERTVRRYINQLSAPRGAYSLVAARATEKVLTRHISYRVLSRCPVTARAKRRQGYRRP